MTRGKQKIEAQKKNAEKNQKGKGSQLEARAVGLKVICPICKVFSHSSQFPFHAKKVTILINGYSQITPIIDFTLNFM